MCVTQQLRPGPGLVRTIPGLKLESERWIRNLAERYGGREGLVGWQLDNEPGFPFVARHGASMEVFCYCHHTEQEFRHWLRDRYQTPEGLSDAWRWDPTHHRYSQWSQVRAPRSTPAHWGVVTAWLDWRRFIAEDLASHIAWQHGLLKQLTPDLPTSTNGFIWSRHDPFGVLIGQDMWRLARCVDAIGYDYYPGIDKRFLSSPEYGGMVLDYAASNARRSGAEYWLSEIESGPINGWAFGPDHWTTPEDIVRINVDGVGTGAKVLLYQGYREWNCIPIHWGALADLEGAPTPRLEAAASVVRVVRDYEELLDEAVLQPADVAFLHAWDNAVVLEGMGSGDKLLDAMTGTYRALAGAGFACEFVAFEDLDRLEAKMLVLPATMLLPAEAGEDVANFVRGGGHLLTFAKVAMLDGRGWFWSVRPGAGLDEVLGVRELAVEAATSPVVIEVPRAAELPGWPGGVVLGSWQWQSLSPTDDSTTVLGHHVDGAPALTRHSFGDGAAWAFGSHLGASQPVGGLSDLIVSVARAAGAKSLFDAPPASDGLPRVYGHLRTSGTRQVLSLTSTADEPINVRVPSVGAVAIDVLTDERINSDEGVLIVAMPDKGSRLLIMEGADGQH